MKQKVLFSLTGYIIGIILTIISFVPFRISYQVSDLVGYLGLMMVVFSIFYGHIVMNKFVKKGKRISSRLTPFYKFYIPAGIVLLFLINGMQLFFDVYPGDDITLFIVLEGMFIIWMILTFHFLKLRAVYLRKNQVFVTDYFEIITTKTSCIEDISIRLMLPARINYRNSDGVKTILVLTKFFETSLPFSTQKSIKKLKGK